MFRLASLQLADAPDALARAARARMKMGADVTRMMDRFFLFQVCGVEKNDFERGMSRETKKATYIASLAKCP